MPKSELREYIEAFVVAVILALFIITFIAQSFLVQGSSMEPSLTHGQRLLVDKISLRFVEPRRGEVVVFRYPADHRRKFIKRIIGRPGDEIIINQGQVFVNSERLEEPYINGPTFGAFGNPRFGPVVVPPHSFFVLGDNRRNSDDSRYPDVGFVSFDHLIGRALFVYWPIPSAGFLRIPSTFSPRE